MGFAYVLYLDDEVAGPTLELMRRVAQPRSRSRPHITVRYSSRGEDKLRDKDLRMYDEASVEILHLQGIGRFPSLVEAERLLADPAQRNPKQTVFLLCESLDLESLVYKPKYPDSVFHITLYDGPASPFADQLCEVLNEFSWDLELRFKKLTKLTRIPTGLDAKSSKAETPMLSEAAWELLKLLTGSTASPHTLYELSDGERLTLVRRLAARLHRELSRAARAGGPAVNDPPPDEREQLPLFGMEEFDPEGLMHLPPPQRWVQERTKEASLFLTPPEIAREMLQEALRVHGDERLIDFGDPALGNGIFFATLMRLIEPARLSSAVGVEIDARRAATVRGKWGGPLQVTRGDFIEHPSHDPRSLVVANPPYLRFQKLDRDRTRAWAEHLGRELNLNISGRADLFVYFVLAAHAWMQEGAVACWLLPTEFMENQYGEVLRRYLTSRVELLRIHVYDRDAPQFDNAKVTSAIVLFRNSRPDSRGKVTLSAGGSMLKPARSRQVEQSELQTRKRWSVQSIVGPVVARRRNGTEASLGQLFRVRRGIATGANSLFVVPDETSRALAIPVEWRKPVVPRARTLPDNVIHADKNGDPTGFDFKWLIDLDADWSSIQQRCPDLAQYLRDVERTVGTRTLVRTRRPFYRQEQIPSPLFLFSYMAPSAANRRSRFFMNESRAVILNNYLGLYPCGALEQALANGSIDRQRVMDALLEVEAVDLADGGRTYSTGLVKLEPSDLASVAVWSSAPTMRRLFADLV